VAREREHSTAIGLGAALPHGLVPQGLAIQGVMGIAPKGIDFDAPDGQPVKLLVLIVTPTEHEERHLQTLASLSEMVSDWKVRVRLMNAEDANEAWEILEVEESRGFNYFLEDEETGAKPETV
jgi:PTS system nitrogen regulatory IIA component